MVQRSDVLTGVDREADGPYEAQPIAKRAPAARRRATMLGLLLAAAHLGLALAGAPAFAFLAAISLLGAALLARRKLAGILAAAFAALLSVGVPLALRRIMEGSVPQLALGVAVVGLGLASLPSLITLVRDAELQYAYGLWARR